MVTALRANIGIAHTWGSTAAERAAPFPCDARFPDTDEALFRALDVAAPAPLVFRWLCQLRAAPYIDFQIKNWNPLASLPCHVANRSPDHFLNDHSYDWLDNGGRRSPRRLTPGSDKLAPGQRFMFIFRLVAFARDEHLTLMLGGPGAVLFGEAAITYRVIAVDDARSRIVVKLLLRYPFWGRWRVLRTLFAWGDLIMMRKQLRTLGGLAERMARREASARR